MARRPMTEDERKANAERVARWRDKHVKGVDGEKERLTLVLDIGTKARLERIAVHYGYRSITQLIEQWSMQTASDIDEENEQKAKQEIISRHQKGD